MKAVFEMGIDVCLTTLEKPNLSKLENAYGKDIVSVIKNTKKINVLQMLNEQSIKKDLEEGGGYNIVINTHGDVDPYYNDSLSKNNAITYCHFPSAKLYIEKEDKPYLEKHLKITRASLSSSKSHSAKPDIDTISTTATNLDYTNILEDDTPIDNFDKRQYLKWLKETYDKMMLNTTIITNSEYSRKAIFDEYGVDDSIVVYPPVDVEKFRNPPYFSDSHDNDDGGREDIVLVVSRIDPAKEIENAVNLAKLLKEKDIGKEMIIAGSLDPYFRYYYSHIKKMIAGFGLADYIQFKIDVTFDELVSLMKKSKALFHPRSGEHFGYP